ncbi:hypothetical protein [Meiothermus sp.]|uniref:hypothetical protein n=1 Tax=Meiothermus sp. TaxID=1955249 RepID=UPI0021DD4077|nr:hypothetical protein [Meiothermus sp.]GIW33778.1 MAG: hypothetical protein KatS3mg072_1111 [Meiothermus sp.]
MDGKTLVIIAAAAGLALWLGMMIGRQSAMPGFAGPVGPGETDTGDTSTIGQVPDPGGVVWT